MITNNAFNRNILRKYLDGLSEDQFIDEVIIPLFSKNGYLLFRRNTHGPGEHGKDIIFYRHVKLFFDNEYVVVQAKADVVGASNVSKYADQLVRALKVPFPAGKGKAELFANYVYFINARKHTNDVNFEFQYLADMKDNIKIIDGDRSIELMIEFDLIPEKLKGQIEEYEAVSTATSDSYDNTVRNLVMEGNNRKINKLLDYDLKINTEAISNDTKRLIINYVFNKWDEDPGWQGTVKPMQWLNRYFDFIQADQSAKLEKVIDEYLSSYHSFDAEFDTAAVIEKISVLQIKSFEESFIRKVVQEVRNNRGRKHQLIINKFTQFVGSGFMSDEYKNISEKVLALLKLYEEARGLATGLEKTNLLSQINELDSEAYYYLYPSENLDNLK